MDKNTIVRNLHNMEELFAKTATDLGIVMSTYFFEPYYTESYDTFNQRGNLVPEDNACGIYYYLPEDIYEKWKEEDTYDWFNTAKELVNLIKNTDKPNEVAMTLEAGYKDLSREMLREVKKYKKKYADNDNIKIDITEEGVYICVKVSLDDMSAYDVFLDIGYELIPWLSDDYSKTL